MSFNFPLVSRTTLRSTTGASLRDIGRVQRRTENLLEQIATGRRVPRPSEDPSLANLAISLEQRVAENGQFQRNISLGRTGLELTDDALANATNIANTARELLLSLSDSTADPSAVTDAAIEVQQLLDQLVTIGNQRLDNRFIFAGSNTNEAPFQATGGFVDFTGNEDDLLINISQGTTIASNLPGSTAFGALTNEILGRVDLDPALTGTTLIRDLNGGAGTPLGQIRIEDLNGVLLAAGTSAVVDLAGSDDVDDIRERILAAVPGLAVNLVDTDGDLVADAIQIDDPAAGANLQITDINNGNVASSLGLATAAGGGGATVTGVNLDPRLTNQTTVASLDFGGAAFDATGIVITNGNNTVAVDFTGVVTVQDLLNRIQTSGASVLSRINADGTGINVVSTLNGSRMQIAENGGNTANQLGLLLTLADAQLRDLNQGSGVDQISGSDIRLVSQDGTAIEVDLSGAVSVQDVVDLINGAAANQDAATATGRKITAAIGNVAGQERLELTDDTGAAVDTLRVEALNGSFAASDLGIQAVDGIQFGAGLGDQDAAVDGVLTGLTIAAAGFKTESLFSVLASMRDALAAGDQKALAALEPDVRAALDRLLESRIEAGSRLIRLDAASARLGGEQVALETLSSETVATDLAQAFAQLRDEQVALEASLRGNSQIISTNLLDFLA